MKSDTELLDWLEDFLLGGCVDACFELDGGVHATFSEMGSEPITFREKNCLRDILQEVSVIRRSESA